MTRHNEVLHKDNEGVQIETAVVTVITSFPSLKIKQLSTDCLIKVFPLCLNQPTSVGSFPMILRHLLGQHLLCI